MVNAIKNAVIALEGSAVGAGPALTNLSKSLRENHTFCTAESILEVSSGLSTYAYYAGKALDNLATVWRIFTDHLPSFIITLGATMKAVPISATLGSIGLLINVARVAKECLSLYRQDKFLSIFEKHAWTGTQTRDVLEGTVQNFDNPEFQEKLPLKFRNIITGRKKLLETLLNKIDAGDQKAIETAERIFARWTNRNILSDLVEIKNLPEVELERALPDWLYLDITNQGGKIYLDNLVERVSEGDRSAVKEASKLLSDMKSYAAKKRIVNILKIVSAVISALSCIAFFVACPWAVGVMFLVLIAIFSGAAYMVNAGYVENREGGFSLKLCIPQFLRDFGVAAWNSPSKIKAWINAKKPKTISYHPFFDRGIEIARHRLPNTVQRKLSAERLERRTRLATQGIFLSGSAAA